MLDKYNRVARIYPAVLSSLPIFVLNYYLFQGYVGDFISSVEAVRWVGGISLYVVLTFLLSQMGRFVGKELFEKTHFKDELSMPTTCMLMHSDRTYTYEHKKKLHAKIFADFGITLCTIAEEEKNDHEARKRIIESISFIRAKVKNGRLLLKHNIEYGFARNLVGSSLIAAYVSIINLIIFGFVFKNVTAYTVSLILALFYSLVIVCGRAVIQRYGVRYAKILVQEYLSL